MKGEEVGTNDSCFWTWELRRGKPARDLKFDIDLVQPKLFDARAEGIWTNVFFSKFKVGLDHFDKLPVVGYWVLFWEM